jgi:hypothetical protein
MGILALGRNQSDLEIGKNAHILAETSGYGLQPACWQEQHQRIAFQTPDFSLAWFPQPLLPCVFDVIRAAFSPISRKVLQQ